MAKAAQPLPDSLLALHEAARRNDAAALRTLLCRSQRHLDSLSAGGRRAAALHVAAEAGSLEALEVLLLEGADANVRRGGDGRTPLHLACSRGAAAAVQLLLNHGADPREAAPSGEAPVHAAAAGGRAQALLCLAQHDSSLLGLRAGPAQSTPLHLLARAGHAAALQALLQGRPQLGPALGAALDLRDAQGLSALDLACEGGHEAAVQALLLGHSLPLGAPQLPCALCAASRRGHQGVVRLLLAAVGGPGRPGLGEELGAGGCCAAGGGQSLVAAVQGGHRGVVRALLEAGLAPPAEALAEAARRGDGEMLGRLLERLHPSSPCVTSPLRQELYSAALVPGRHALLAQLLRWGLDPHPHGHPAHPAPLLRAVAGHNLPAARLLLRHGVAPDGRPATDGRAPLHGAASALDLEGSKLLLARGADPRVRDAQGRTPLELALRACADPALVGLAAAARPAGTPPLTERRLLLLVEALAPAPGGGGSYAACCERLLREAGPGRAQELARPSLLLLAARGRAWAPERHGQWPAGFRAAARALLLITRARGVGPALVTAGRAGHCSGGGGGGSSGRERASKKRGVSRLRGIRLGGEVVARGAKGARASLSVLQQEPGGGQQQLLQQQRVWLPREVCHVVLALASHPVSAWVV